MSWRMFRPNRSPLRNLSLIHLWNDERCVGMMGIDHGGAFRTGSSRNLAAAKPASPQSPESVFPGNQSKTVLNREEQKPLDAGASA